MPLLNVGEFDFYIEYEELLFPSFCNYHPFLSKERNKEPLLFHLKFRELPEVAKGDYFDFCTDNGIYYVYLKDEICDIIFYPGEGERKFRLRAKRDWSYVETNVVCRQPLDYMVLNDFIMVAFVYSAAFRQTVLLHSSCVKQGEQGVAFVGPSGIGKSTHSRLWLEYIPECSLLNDDQPAVRLVDGVAYLYGTPWSGKTACYKNERAILLALFRMEQATENKIIPLTPIRAFQMLLASCSMMKEDEHTFNHITQTLSVIAGQVRTFHLRSRPEKAAAELSFIYSLD